MNNPLTLNSVIRNEFVGDEAIVPITGEHTKHKHKPWLITYYLR